MSEGEVTQEDLIEQAEKILSATRATMYYPVAHGEAARFMNMIEDIREDEDD